MKLVTIATTALAVLLGVSPAPAQQSQFKLVVHRSNDLRSLPADAVSDYFMKKKTTWPDGSPVKPVDLSVDSKARQAFSKAVLDKQASAVRMVWQRQVFSGRVAPPPEVASELVLLAYIGENPGAIGYVSADAPLGPGVKVVDVVRGVASR
jgi:ABC-type phosphate transport system substrate-binding protein